MTEFLSNCIIKYEYIYIIYIFLYSYRTTICDPHHGLIILGTGLREIRQVEVFALDFSTNPCGLTEIHTFDGDCIFVDSCVCKSVPSGLHGVEGDAVYFVDQYSKYEHGYFDPSYDTFVYNVRNGTTRPFAVELSPGNFGAPKDVPVWLLTSK
jgi:hypothetical protein